MPLTSIRGEGMHLDKLGDLVERLTALSGEVLALKDAGQQALDDMPATQQGGLRCELLECTVEILEDSVEGLVAVAEMLRVLDGAGVDLGCCGKDTDLTEMEKAYYDGALAALDVVYSYDPGCVLASEIIAAVGASDLLAYANSSECAYHNLANLRGSVKCMGH